jgi:Xaa-Pro aminopeptidase
MKTVKSSSLPPAGDLEQIRGVQALAYRCAEHVAGDLRPGITERQASARLRRLLVDEGVDDWFHVPFAWFGERTTLQGFRNPLKFFPTARRLEEGMPYILDVAPVRGGSTADIGYSGCLGRNEIFSQMMGDLADYRSLVLDEVRAGTSLRDIYRSVDRLAAKHGYIPAHQAYPGKVLAHQVWPVHTPGPRTVVAGFGNRSLRLLARSLLVSIGEGWSPLWNGGRRSDHAPVVGLWAVEPHLGFRDVGVKFEELLVVTEGGAYWLDDDLPHVRRWNTSSESKAA